MQPFVVPLLLSQMDLLAHPLVSYKEGLWCTAVTLAINCRDQLLLSVKIAEIGAQGQLV